MIDPNWPRWIKASAARWFDGRLSADLPMFIEGGPRPSAPPPSSCEFRIDGPDVTEPSVDFFELDVEINLLVATARDARDLYRHERAVGLVAAAFVKDIPVFKLGDDPTAQLGCLVLSRPGRVTVTTFGQFGTDVLRDQTTVEAPYRLQLSS